ncbi:MAG: carboxymuconolactone decarboxylase family protein [Acidimicrobiales bacterium]
MSRATPVTYDAATPEQQEVWDSIIASRGDPATLVGEDGALVGPFNSMVSSPTIGKRMGDLGEAVRFSSSVDNRLLEMAIITVGAHWRSNFEWYAHSRLAAAAGVDQSVIDAMAEGREPSFEKQDDATVHRFAHQLVGTGRVEQAAYDAARELLGEQGVLDLITTIGYYSLVSLTLNALEVPLPGGQTPTWPD